MSNFILHDVYMNDDEKNNIIRSIINNNISLDNEYKEFCIKIFNETRENIDLTCYNKNGDSLLRHFIIDIGYCNPRDHNPDEFYNTLIFLLEGGIDPNQMDCDGYSLFHHLMQFLTTKTMDKKYIDLFLKHGADINLRDRNGSSVFAYVCRQYNPNYYKSNRIYDVDETILDYVIKILSDKIDIYNLNNRGQTIMMELFMNDDFKTLDIIVEKLNINISYINNMVNQSLKYLLYRNNQRGRK